MSKICDICIYIFIPLNLIIIQPEKNNVALVLKLRKVHFKCSSLNKVHWGETYGAVLQLEDSLHLVELPGSGLFRRDYLWMGIFCVYTKRGRLLWWYLRRYTTERFGGSRISRLQFIRGRYRQWVDTSQSQGPDMQGTRREAQSMVFHRSRSHVLRIGNSGTIVHETGNQSHTNHFHVMSTL